MLQLLQRNKLASSFLIVGLICLIIGVIQLLPGATAKQHPIIVHPANEKQQNQNDKNKGEIQQSDTKSTTSSAIIKVDVAGAVVNPGVYELEKDARINKALEAAGGVAKKADTQWLARNLNLATRLDDGDKIFIPAIGEPKPQLITQEGSSQQEITPVNHAQQQTPQIAGLATTQPGLQKSSTNPPTPQATPQATQQSDGKININTASASELDVLPGVGEVTAQKIIDNRPYTTLEELKEKKAVNKSTYEKIKDKIKL